jgi:hypothetical protein
LSAEARRTRRLEAERTPPPPPPGQREGARPHLLGRTEASKVSEIGLSNTELAAEEIRRLLCSDDPKEREKGVRLQGYTVAKVEPEKKEPEPKPVGDAPRAHSLVDLLELAAKAGLEVSEEAVIAAIRQGTLARDAERTVEHPSARQGFKLPKDVCPVLAAPAAGEAGSAG